MAGEPEGRFVFEITKPADKKKIGVEAQKMVDWVRALSMVPAVRARFEAVVRQGFDYNFEVEGSAAGPWQDLAEMTQTEREQMLLEGSAGLVPGFSPTHPILQRTGKYRRSWAEADDPDALVILERQSQNTLFMHIGSEDPRVAKLSGGGTVDVFAALASEGVSMSQDVFAEFGVEPQHPWGGIPPRPVHHLFDQFEDALGELGESFGKMMADTQSSR